MEKKFDFDFEQGGYRFTAQDSPDSKGDSVIDISKDGDSVKSFLWPSYKIWNIPAHADDIIEGLERASDSGLRVAGATGFGGNVYNG